MTLAPAGDDTATGWITDSTPSTRFPFYTRANTGEVAPNPMSPLGWQIVWRNGTVPGYEDGHVRWGSFVDGELGPDDLQFACFGGYIYHCWSMVRVQGERSPGMSAQLMDDAFFGTHPDIPPYVAHPDDDDPRAEGRIQGTMDWLMGMTELPDELAEDRAKALAARDARPELESATDAELVERALSLSPLIQEFFDPYMVYGSASSMAMGVLAPLCEGLDPQIPSQLIAGIGGVDSVPPSQAIWDLGPLGPLVGGADRRLRRRPRRRSPIASTPSQPRATTARPTPHGSSPTSPRCATSTAPAVPSSGTSPAPPGRPAPSSSWPWSIACASPTTTSPPPPGTAVRSPPGRPRRPRSVPITPATTRPLRRSTSVCASRRCSPRAASAPS